MKYIIENELLNIINDMEEENKISFLKSGSEVLLITLLKKESSLINCLCKVKVKDVLDYIKTENIITDGKTNCLLEKAKEISEKDEQEEITDEHILYSILKDGENNAIKILENMGIDTSLMLLTVNEYLEFNEDEYLINLSKEIDNGKYNPYIGKENYISKVIRILSKKNKSNCMILGPSGVGKSALVEGVCKELNLRKSKYNIYRIEIGALMAGTRYRGDLEERLMSVLNKIKERNAILFIDEIHMIMGNYHSEDTLSIGNILKPALSRGDIKVIGATTLEEYNEYISKDEAFCRRFQNIYLYEPTKDETLNILKKIKEIYENYYSCKINNRLLKDIILYGDYFPNKYYPDKAIDLLDEYLAYIKESNKKISKKSLKKIVLENLGIGINQKTNNKMNKKYNKLFSDFLDPYLNRKIIGKIEAKKENISNVLNDIKDSFNLDNIPLIDIDLEFFDEGIYLYMLKEVLKNPISIIYIMNYEKANMRFQNKINNIIQSGAAYDTFGRKVYFKNTLFVFNKDSIEIKAGFI